MNVAVSQIDGSTGDNIIVGTGPGMASEVKVFGAEMPSSLGEAPALFAAFVPYPGDSSGVTVSAGFVDFSTGRNSIVTAPGSGMTAEVKVYVFPLLKSVSAEIDDSAAKGLPQPVTSTAFMPFGNGYRGGVSLATGWLAGRMAGGDVEGGEQRRRAVALVVMSAPFDLPGAQGQERLGAVERLDLALLVDAQ